MKKITKVRFALLIVLSVFIFGCGGGGDSGAPCATPTVNANGTFKWTSTNRSNTCGGTVGWVESADMAVTQTGNALTISGTRSGSGQICGNTVTFTVTYSDPPGTITETATGTVTNTNPTTFTGTSSWTYRQTGYTCTGIDTFTATKLYAEIDLLNNTSTTIIHFYIRSAQSGSGNWGSDRLGGITLVGGQEYRVSDLSGGAYDWKVTTSGGQCAYHFYINILPGWRGYANIYDSDLGVCTYGDVCAPQENIGIPVSEISDNSAFSDSPADANMPKE